MNNKIADAIKAGKLEHQKKIEEDKLKEAERRKKFQEYYDKCEKEAKKWVEQTLPDIIRTKTAEGCNSFMVGSSDYGCVNPDVLCRVHEARKIGLKITEVSYEADPGEEGCYSHGAGCSYYIEWDL